ncbi:MAG: hypothetical protein FWE22_05975 [Firmicutes bacterium]|nr:hypothetical protein [Bacillota bacterium]
MVADDMVRNWPCMMEHSDSCRYECISCQYWGMCFPDKCICDYECSIAECQYGDPPFINIMVSVWFYIGRRYPRRDGLGFGPFENSIIFTESVTINVI